MRFSTRFCGLLTLLLASSATLAAGHGSGTTVHARRLEKRQVKLDVSDLQQLGDVLGVDLPTVSAGPIEVGPIEVPPVVVDPSPAPTEDDEILIPPPTSTTPEPTPEVPAPSPSAPVSSDPAPTSNDPVSSDPVSTPASSDPVSTPASSEPASTPASSDPASTTDAPTSSAAEPSTTPGGILSSILAPITSAIVDPITSAVLPPVSSAVSEIVDPITSAVLPPVSSVVSEIVDTVTSVIDPVTSAVSSVASEIVDPVTSVIVDPITSVVSDVISTITSDVVPPVSSVISDIPSVITDVPPVITDVSSVVSSVITNLPSEITDPPLPSTIFSDPPISEPTPDPTPSAEPSQSPSAEPSQSPSAEPSQSPSAEPSQSPSAEPSQPSQSPSAEPSQPSQSPSVEPSQPEPSQPEPSQPSQSPSVEPSQPSVTPSSTIVFPSGRPSSLEPEEPSSAVPSESVSPSSIVVDPGLSFVLTETSLALAPVTTSRSVDPTLSDPDQETTSVATSEFAPTASTTISVAALPTGLPNKIYPVNRLSADSDLEGMTLISILFSSLLNWPFVVSDELSSSQLFAFVPVLITSGLEIGSDSVKTYALQVHIPTTYRSPQDAAELGTMWLGYIPTDQVDTLAALIKAKNSRFYTAAPNPVARALAQHVNTGFNLVSVRDPIGGGSGGDSSGTGQSGATSDGSKSRQDAIIGVVSALGAIALLVLVFLVYRSLKRRKEMAHRRLSDPPGAADLAGYRQEGREFDQDSIGGQRRRSFYFAQDSLRQGQAQDESYSYLQHQPQQGGGYGATAYGGGQQQMSQRRGMPQGGAISAPILQQSSMNW